MITVEIVEPGRRRTFAEVHICSSTQLEKLVMLVNAVSTSARADSRSSFLVRKRSRLD